MKIRRPEWPFPPARICPRRRGRWRLLALILACSAGVACAHDPFEITTAARLYADRLELVITMAPSTAMAVSADAGETVRFHPDDFEKLRPRFEAGAARLFEVTAGGKRLSLARATVGLAREFDIEFRLTFPAPMRGPLRLRAAHVAKLPAGYGDVLTLHGVTGELLGQKLLMADDLDLVVPLPRGAAVAPAVKPTFWRRVAHRLE